MTLLFLAGIAVLLAAGFFGYMLALLQRRVGVMVSSTNVSTSHSLQQPINVVFFGLLALALLFVIPKSFFYRAY